MVNANGILRTVPYRIPFSRPKSRFSSDQCSASTGTAGAGRADVESTPVTAKDRKEARKMRRRKRQNADVFAKPAGKKDRLELATAVELSEDITPLHSAYAAGAAADMEITAVAAKDRKEARKMCRKKRQHADVVTKPAGKKDRLELAVEKDSLSANKWNEIDGRTTDVKNTKPKKLSYAKITKKRKLSWKRDKSSKNTPQSE
jgi:hypothetical protein